MRVVRLLCQSTEPVELAQALGLPSSNGADDEDCQEGQALLEPAPKVRWLILTVVLMLLFLADLSVRLFKQQGGPRAPLSRAARIDGLLPPQVDLIELLLHHLAYLDGRFHPLLRRELRL